MSGPIWWQAGVNKGNVRAVVLAEIAAEDDRRLARDREPEARAIIEENRRRSQLPSEERDHICGMECDGQDGSNSVCARIRRKLGYS